MARVVSAALPSLEEVREAVGRLLSDPAVVQQLMYQRAIKNRWSRERKRLAAANKLI